MSNNSAGTHSTQRPAWLFFTAVMLAYAFVVLAAGTPPRLVDYPDWVYQGVLFKGVLTAHPVPGYALKSYPVPNSLTTVGLGVLDCVFPWQLAAKLWICIYLALAALATFLLSRALACQQSALIVALPAILFLNLDFWYGHISFHIGLCLFMILIALALRSASTSTLSLFLVLIFFAHMEALACAVLFIACWAISTRKLRLLWSLGPALALTIWYALGRFAHGNTDAAAASTASGAYGSGSFLIYKANTFFKPFGYINARDLGGASFSEALVGKPLFVTLAVLSILLGILVLFFTFRALLDRRNPPYLRVVILVLVALAALLPQAVLGTADPGSRLLLIAAMIGLFLSCRPSRAIYLTAALSVLFCAANLWQFARIQGSATLQPHAEDLPAPILTYGHVEPFMRDSYYQRLSAGEMNAPIFPTGIFLDRRVAPR